MTSAFIDFREADLLGPTGEVIRITSHDDPVIQSAAKLSLWFLGGMFALLGSAVLLRRPDLGSARWFGGFSAFTATALAVGPAAAGPQPAWALMVQAATLVGIGATCFPFVVALLGHQQTSRLTRASIVFASAGIVFMIAYGVSVLVSPAIYDLVRPGVLLYVSFSILGAVGVLGIASARQRSQIRLQQAWIALLGIGLGTLPFIALTLVPEAFTSEALVPSHISVLAVGLIPIAFAYAILQHDLLGIRRLVHRGMVYGITTISTFAVITAALFVAASLMPVTSESRVALVLFALLLTGGTVLFLSLRRLARALVDRLLYGELVRYEAFVDAVRGNLASSSPVNEVFKGIASRLVNGLRLESTVLFLGTDLSDHRMVAAEGPRADEVVQELYPRLRTSILAAHDQDLAELRWESESLLVMNLRASGRWIGYALLGPKLDGEVFVEDEKRLVATVTPLLALSVDQSMLSGDLRKLNQRLVKAQETERGRLAIDLHDGPLQKAILLARPDDTAAQDRAGLGRELVAELKQISSRLRPSILDDLGLVPSIEWLLEGVSNRSEIAIGLTLSDVDQDERLHTATELALFRVTQEAINNVLKHADATSLDVSLSRERDTLVLMVVDDGVGFLPSSNHNGGVGLSGMRERVVYLDGTFEANSTPGAGTTIVARVPSEKTFSEGTQRGIQD